MARFLVSFALFLAVATVSGCMLDRSALGCVEGSDDSGRCLAAADGGADASDAYVPIDGRIPDAHIEPDAFMDPDASMMDAGPDASDAHVDPDGGPPDAGPPDGGPVDACVAVAESCNGRDDNCDGRIDEGTTCPLRITFSAATGETGLFIRIAWNGPGGPEMADYYLACRVTGAVATCTGTYPELASGRIIRFFPFNDTADLRPCTAVTCPTLCSRTECPGYPPMGTYAYAIAYLTNPVLDGEVTLSTDPGTAIDGPMPGDSAWLEFRLP